MKDEIQLCEQILKDDKESMAKRFRALFTLRNNVSKESIDAIGKVLLNDDSDLLKHECAYCMGQMADPQSIPYLTKAIKDEDQHPMVRHESGEALGAIGVASEDIIGILKQYSTHPVRELKETCDLALDRLAWFGKSAGPEPPMNATSNETSNTPSTETGDSIYNTIDPTPRYPTTTPLQKLKSIYLDESASLFERYRALFTLRDIGTPEAIRIICDGLFGSKNDSALYKHEVAFVLGQIQSPDTVEALSRKLADVEENEIVRHECAEALGSIGESEIIRKYLTDESRIVRESCQVALDMADYENDPSQFELLEACKA